MQNMLNVAKNKDFLGTFEWNQMVTIILFQNFNATKKGT